MTTIIGPGVDGELRDRWEHIHTHTHTVTRKDTTCSNGSAEHTKSQTYNSTLTDLSQGSCVQSSRPSSIPESSAALRPASEVVGNAHAAATIFKAIDVIERDRREVVRAFVEWYNTTHYNERLLGMANHFIRTHLGGEQ